MSRHFPVCSANDVVRVLRRNGFVFLVQRGSHQKWRHVGGRQVIVPAREQADTDWDVEEHHSRERSGGGGVSVIELAAALLKLD